MKRFVVLLFSLFTLFCSTATPFTFDEASSNVQEFVIVKITNAVTNATIVLSHDPYKNPGHLYESFMPYYVQFELGLVGMYCAEVLKGDLSVGGYTKCYFYKTPRCSKNVPQIEIWGSFLDGSFGLRYYERGKWVTLSGRDAEMFINPPYDPYSSEMDDFVKFMIVTAESQLDVGRIELDKWECRQGSVMDLIGLDYTNKTPVEIMRKLNVGTAFSNRVFRLKEGCAFQVDYPVPENNAWQGYEFKTKAEYIAEMNRIHAENTSLMHLSPDEVSEITYLAYFADNVDTNGYNAACSRCPLILRPVTEFKTTIGKRLRQAMREGGMITTNNLPNVAAAP